MISRCAFLRISRPLARFRPLFRAKPCGVNGLRHFHEELVAPAKEQKNPFAEKLYDKKDMNDIFAILLEARQQGRADIQMWRIVMSKVVESTPDDMNEILAVIKEAEKDGIVNDSSLHTVVLRSLARLGRMRLIVRYTNHMLKNGTTLDDASLREISQGFLARKDYEGLLSFYKQFCMAVKLSDHLIEILASASLKLADLDTGIKFIQEVLHRGNEPSASIQNMVAVSLMHAGQLRRGTEVVDLLRSKGLPVSSLARALYESSMVQLNATNKELKTAPPPRRVQAHASVAHNFIDAGTPNLAIEYLEGVMKNGVGLSKQASNALLKAYSKQKQVLKAIEYAKTMRQNHQMFDDNVNYFVRALIKDRKPEMAESVLSEMYHWKIPIDAGTTFRMFSEFISRGRKSDALRLLEHLKTKRDLFYQKVIPHLVSVDQHELAVRMYDDMLIENFSPPLQLFQGIIISHMQNRFFKAATEWIERFKTYFPLDDRFKEFLARLWAHNACVEEAIKLYFTIGSPSSQLKTHIMQESVRFTNYEAAIKFAEKIREISPNSPEFTNHWLARLKQLQDQRPPAVSDTPEALPP